MSFRNDSKKILHIAIPLLSSRIVGVIVFFTGFIMIAKLGPYEFAASSLGSSIFVTLIMICVGILYATGIKISQSYGAKHYEKIREYFYGGILLSVILAALCCSFMIGIAFLLPYFGQKPVLIPYAEKFLFALTLPVLPALLNMVANQILTALMKTRIIFITNMINVPISIFFLYVLIFGKWGFPKMGIWGFGTGFLIGDIALVIIPALYIYTIPFFKQFDLLNFSNVWRNLIRRLFEIVKLGLPMGIQFGAEISVMSITTFLIGRFGVSALSAYQISSQIIVVALMIPFTFSEASGILVGQSLGKQDPIGMRSYGFNACKLGTIFLCAVSIIFFTVPKLLTSIYINIHNPSLQHIVHLSVMFLYVAAFSQLFDGVRNIITGSLRGLNDSKSPMYVGIFVMWCISLPLGILLAFPLKFGPIGFALSAAIAFATGATILLIRFHRKTKLSR